VALLPVRAVELDVGVIEYICINCRSRRLFVWTARGLVIVSPPLGEKYCLEPFIFE
jgi:hypothetical protein